MVLFGGLHLSILFTTIALPWALSRLTRRNERPGLARGLAATLAGILVLDRVFVLVWAEHAGKILRWADALPMHLCDWATFAVIIALVWRGPLAYELAYFWGLSGTFQAVLTPDVSEAATDPLFVSFFVSHCGIIVSVLFLTWGLGMRPRPGSVLRAWVGSQVYAVCAGLTNWTLHADFGYLAAKPPHSSLLDYFGPWPWYILTLEAMSLVFYVVFYAPFWIADRRTKTR